ncbi:MAG: 1-acyl-sn-glycerol-3-phosphate acyltransferase, partial [Alphaproteobacteria bacterium]|nr:1-acyl-sn-glycerol-3-phosphate acyltransferase [Alphaproteobacteria bacterium]
MQDTAELSTSARAWRALRRTTLVPMVLVVALVSAALLPLTLAAALLIDALRRRRWALTRTLLVLQIDAWVEAVAMLRAGLSWLRWFGRWQAPGYHQDSHQLELWWATTLLDAARRIYALELVAEGLECAATGPFLLLPRHVSIADTLLPIALLARRYGLEPRYVVKRELELDPVLDVVGHRLDTAFVARRGRDPEGDRARVARLAQGLGPEHFVVLYPEGTRFSRQKQARLVQKAREEHDDHLARRVARYQNTLPPHPGGT